MDKLYSGLRIGSYELLSPIGSGGMGEVWQARDPRVDRFVAIKFSRAGFSERFERESRAVAALNHPHICQLYDVGPDYLVMEYVEGKPIQGPLSVPQALRLAVQIADALDAAHRKGILHRDLKPANILVTKAGVIKVLDFGLAKMSSPPTQSPAESAQTAEMTQAGAIVGTLPYMAPERLEGREAQPESDIFAFGCVLYEMLAGKKAFAGSSAATLIASIMEKEPARLTSRQATVPPALEHLIQVCLAKDADSRWHCAADLRRELEWLASGTPVPPQTVKSNRNVLLWVTLGVLFAIAGIASFFNSRANLKEQRLVSFAVPPPEKTSFALFDTPALSPDGRLLAFTATDDSAERHLWIRPLDSAVPRRLDGTENASFPFWSPDNRSIGFFVKGKLRRIDVSGGLAQTICDAPNGRGASWSPSGSIVFAPEPHSPLFQVSSSGGDPKPLTSFDASRQEVSHRWPGFLPDGNRFLYLVRSSRKEYTGVYVGSLDSKRMTRVLPDPSNAAYVSTPQGGGRLLFARNGTLMGQRFDLKKLEVRGDAFRIAQQVGYTENIEPVRASFSVSNQSASNASVLAYIWGRSADRLTWFDRGGARLQALWDAGTHLTPALSPDGANLAVDRFDPQTETQTIWRIDLARGIPSLLTSGPVDGSPVWSPDGARIAFTSRQRSGVFDLYQTLSSGSGEREELLKSDFWKFPTSWSPDGRFLLYMEISQDKTRHIWALPLFGAKQPVRLLQGQFNEFDAVFSPDGKWFAYSSDESGKVEIYVQPFAPSSTSGGKWKISSAGGVGPRWPKPGTELFYLAPDRRIMAVELKTGNTFQAGVPRALFDAGMVDDFRAKFDVAAGGKRFLVPAAVSQSDSAITTITLNWMSGIKQ